MRPLLNPHARHVAAWIVAQVLFASTSDALADGAACVHDRIGEDVSPPFPPYTYPKFFQTLVGLGAANGAGSTALVLTTEIGHRPLAGALGTGFSLSSATAVDGSWTVITPGLLAKLDLTYVFAGGLWAAPPPDDFPFRLQLGGRLGLAMSDSFPTKTPYGASYLLFRPELQPFLDLEVLPFGLACLPRDRIFSLIVRLALDAPVNLSDVFRFSGSIGLNYGWGDG
jgi:hypothetical protein